MSEPKTTEAVRLTPLQPHDGGPVRRWLADHLRHHHRTWVEARGLGWSDGEVDAQLLATDLVAEHWHRLVRAASHADDRVLVARHGNRAVGIVWASARVDEHLRVPTGVLQWVYVERTTRRQGSARRLVLGARRWMIDQGLRSVVVSVLADNEAAVRLYRAVGLVPADLRMMGPLGPDEPG